MASFQANIGWERPRKREKKKQFRWVPTRPGIGNSKNIAKKLKKNLKTPSQVRFKTK